MGDLTALVKLVMLIEQIPSDGCCVDPGAKILAEASIFHHVGTKLLSTVALDFLAKVVEVLNCGEVTMLFGSRLIIHDGKKGEHKEGSTDGGKVDRGEVGSARGALIGCRKGSGSSKGGQ